MVLPFSISSIVSAVIVYAFLPETKGEKLPETIEDVENPNSVKPEEIGFEA